MVLRKPRPLVARELRAAGAVVAAGHCEELEDWNGYPFDAFEVYNLHAQFKAASRWSIRRQEAVSRSSPTSAASHSGWHPGCSSSRHTAARPNIASANAEDFTRNGPGISRVEPVMRTLKEIHTEIEILSEERTELWHRLSAQHDPEVRAEIHAIDAKLDVLWDEHRAVRARLRFGDREKIVARARVEERLERAA